ncbi:MAG: hypothetical protein AB7S26_28615 [Sandaracinaceae bacterium]
MKDRDGRTAFVIAVVMVAGYVVLEALGLREWVSVLSGTPVPGVAYEVAALGAIVYVASYFGAVLIAPILAMAAVMMRASAWVERRWLA